jgi:MFS family permease
MLNSPLPVYIKHMGANDAKAGLVTGLFALSSMIMRPFYGNLLDRKGRKVILLIGIALSGFIGLSYIWASSVFALLALRFMQGVGMSAYSTASNTMASDLIPKKRLVEGFGYYGAVQPITGAIGPLVGLSLIARDSFTSLFISIFVLSVLSFIIAIFVNYEKRFDNTEWGSGEEVKRRSQLVNHRVPAAKDLEALPKSAPPNDLLEKTAIPTALATSFICNTNGVIMTFLPSYGFSLGLENISVFFTANAIGVLLTRPFIGRLTERFGLTKMITSSIFILASSMMIISQSVTIWMFIPAGILNGLSYGALMPIMNSLVIQFCRPKRKGAANGTYGSSVDIGIGAGSMIGGVLVNAVGYSSLFALSSASVFISLAIYIFVIRKQPVDSLK